MTNATHIKTPCASAVLAYFGVHGVTWNNRTQKNVWMNTLRRNGFKVRSRNSQIKIGRDTVGKVRTKIQKMAARENIDVAAYIIRVEEHVFIVDKQGNTIVDTDPRKRDRRKVRGIFAVACQ